MTATGAGVHFSSVLLGGHPWTEVFDSDSVSEPHVGAGRFIASGIVHWARADKTPPMHPPISQC